MNILTVIVLVIVLVVIIYFSTRNEGKVDLTELPDYDNNAPEDVVNKPEAISGTDPSQEKPKRKYTRRKKVAELVEETTEKKPSRRKKSK